MRKMKLSLKRCGIPVLLVALFLPTLSFAQLDTGTIMGRVTDRTGGVMPGTQVDIRNMGTSATVSVLTDETGVFIAPVLPVGTYEVTASLPGFSTVRRSDIRLSVNARLNLSFVLEPGEIADEITITGDAPVIETASTTLGAVVGGREIAELPLSGRAVDQLAALAPGVVYLGPQTQRSMSGQAQALWNPATRWLVDGGDSSQVDSDLAHGGYASQARVNRVSVDAVAEFRHVTTMYSAEYGQAGAGVVNFITKSGTNQFRGSLFHFLRNDALDARNYFNQPPAPKPPFRMNQFGGTLGGPIVREKLFFFGTYEGVRQNLGRTFNPFVPTQEFRDSLDPVLRPAVDMLPLPNGPVSPSEPRLAQLLTTRTDELRENAFMYKVDYEASDKDRIAIRHNINKSLTKLNFGAAEGQWRDVPSTPQTGMISYTRSFSPTLLNQFGFYINRLDVQVTGAGTDAVRAFPQTSFGSGSAGVGPATFDMDVRNTSFTFMNTLSWVKGRHQMKFGAQVVRMHANKLVNDQNFITFANLDGFFENQPFILRTEGWPRPGIRGTQNDFFVQNDIRASERLTLNLGLRYKYDTTPTEAHGRIANFDMVTGTLDEPGTKIFDSPKNNFGPRIGLAFSPFDSQRTVIRAGYGLFHIYLNAAEVQFLPTNIPGFGNRFNVNILQDPTLKAFPFPDISGFPASTALFAFNKDWKRAYTQHWNLNIQQAVFDDHTVLQIGYVGNRGVNLNRSIQGNLFVPGTSVRTFPDVGAIDYQIGGRSSSYNALQIAFNRRMNRGLGFNVYYTWSHSLDDGSGNGQIPWDRRAEWASSDHDVRHNLTLGYIYELPTLGALPGWLGSGWQINGITSMRTGFPVNPGTNRDPFGIGIRSARPNLVPGVSTRPSDFDMPSNQFNIGAFTPPPAGSWGNAGRNILKGPAAFNWDFSLFKNFRVTERQRIQFRAEAFNLFNTPQFNTPSSNIDSPATFGQSRSISPAAGSFLSNRQIQFGLKYDF